MISIGPGHLTPATCVALPAAASDDGGKYTMEDEMERSDQVLASLDGIVWMPMGANITHVEAAKRYALQELVPKHEPASETVFTKWLSSKQTFRHKVEVGICCDVTPIREDG